MKETGKAVGQRSFDSPTNEETMKSVDKDSTDSPGVFVFPPVLLLTPMLLSLVFNFVWPLHFPRTVWIKIAGGLLFIAGVFLAGWGRRTMMRAGTNVPPHKPTLTIVTNGPFRFTRNPLYLGGTAAYLGLSLGLNLLWAPILLVPMLFLLNWGIVSREERYLEKKFGEMYRVYKGRVPRWF